MLQKQFTSELGAMSIPRVGTLVEYRHFMGDTYRIFTGRLLGTNTCQVRRYNQQVMEFIVEPLPGQTCLSFHVVDESDFLGAK